MTGKTRFSGPVVVGGLGGSGTRVVAEILIEFGFYLGSDLNAANDNLWFTLLFKRPRWFVGSSNGEIFKALRIFEKAMAGCLGPERDEFSFMMHAAVEIALFGHNHLGAGRGVWPFLRVIRMIRSKQLGPSLHTRWGWKEPNSHIYIEYLSEHFDDLRYIHVMRHGLDMAYSHNQQQLYSWGSLFGVQSPTSSELLPRASLNYWIKANEKAITLGKRLLRNRFLVINFDEFVLAPRKGIEELVHFLELDQENINISEVSDLPKIPRSIGRYKKHDTGIFSEDEINAVRKLGFVVDGNSS